MSHNCQGDQAEGVEQSNQPILCAKGCGFFANPACNNLCSKCYRDSQLAEEREASSSKAAAAALSDVHQLPEIKDIVAPENVAHSQQSAPAVPQLGPGRQEPPPRAASPPAPSGKVENSCESTSSAGDRPPHRPQQANSGRCFACNKKVGLTGFKCRCEYIFCGAHRLAEAHHCSFDYKQLGRQRLAESNPLIQAAKMDKL